MNLHQILVHSHRTIVTIYVIVFLVKVGYLFFASPAKFQRLRDRTRWFEMVFGTLVLVSGLWLYFGFGWYKLEIVWIHLKLALVLVGTALGIVALKKANKPLALVVAVLFVFVYLLGQTRGRVMGSMAMEHKTECPALPVGSLDTQGAVLLSRQDCARFHGNSQALARVEGDHLPVWATPPSPHAP